MNPCIFNNYLECHSIIAFRSDWIYYPSTKSLNHVRHCYDYLLKQDIIILPSWVEGVLS